MCHVMIVYIYIWITSGKTWPKKPEMSTHETLPIHGLVTFWSFKAARFPWRTWCAPKWLGKELSQIDFPSSATLRGEVVWGGYNLTRWMVQKSGPSHYVVGQCFLYETLVKMRGFWYETLIEKREYSGAPFSEATILSNMAIWVVLIYDYISGHILFCIVLYTQKRTRELGGGGWETQLNGITKFKA